MSPRQPVSPVSIRARQLHAQHHPDDGHVTCDGCRTAASWLIEGRERGNPRPRRAGEVATYVPARALVGDKYVGRIIQVPGHRGYLRSATVEVNGGIHVSTASGVAVYPPSEPFAVWGP